MIGTGLKRHLVAVTFAMAMLSQAQPAPAANNLARAKRLFKRAEKQFAAGDYQKALELYQKAYDNKPLPTFHLNIGQCYNNLEQYEKAIHHYRKYLELSKNPRHRQDAENLIELSQKALDDQKRQAEEVEAMAQEVEPEPPAPSQPALTPQPQPQEKPSGRLRLRPLYFWSGVGLTSAMLLTGTITGALALGKSSEFKDPATPADRLRDLKDSGESLRTASTTTFAIGAVAAIGTAALYFFTDFDSSESDTAALTAIPLSTGGLVVLTGSL